jgi:hypothetical protein
LYSRVWAHRQLRGGPQRACWARVRAQGRVGAHKRQGFSRAWRQRERPTIPLRRLVVALAESLRQRVWDALVRPQCVLRAVL